VGRPLNLSNNPKDFCLPPKQAWRDAQLLKHLPPTKQSHMYYIFITYYLVA